MNHNGTNALPLHIHDDKNGLDYTLHGDYIPKNTYTGYSQYIHQTQSVMMQKRPASA